MSDVCRFCLSEYANEYNPLITPCGCVGSVKYVHKKCLETWRHTTPITENKVYCQLCHIKYILPRRWPEEIIPQNGLIWNSLLLYSFVIIGLMHFLNLLCLSLITNYAYDTIDTTNLIYYNGYSKFYCYLITVFITSAYVTYYASLLSYVINRRQYLYYGIEYIVRQLAISLICAYLIRYTFFPFGHIAYIYSLTLYKRSHILILEKINNNGFL